MGDDRLEQARRVQDVSVLPIASSSDGSCSQPWVELWLLLPRPLRCQHHILPPDRLFHRTQRRRIIAPRLPLNSTMPDHRQRLQRRPLLRSQLMAAMVIILTTRALHLRDRATITTVPQEHRSLSRVHPDLLPHPGLPVVMAGTRMHHRRKIRAWDMRRAGSMARLLLPLLLLLRLTSLRFWRCWYVPYLGEVSGEADGQKK